MFRATFAFFVFSFIVAGSSAFAEEFQKVGDVITVRPSEQIPHIQAGTYWQIIEITFEQLKTFRGSPTGIFVPTLKLKRVTLDFKAIGNKLDIVELGGYLSGSNLRGNQVLVMDPNQKLHVEFFAEVTGLFQDVLEAGKTTISVRTGDALPELPEGYSWQRADPADSVYELRVDRTAYILIKKDANLTNRFYVSHKFKIMARDQAEVAYFTHCLSKLSEFTPRH